MSINFAPIYGESPSSTRLPVNVDAAGNLITTPLASGTQAVNLTQVNGAALSATNPVPTAPNIILSSTATLTSVNGAASSTSLLAANASRKAAYFYNDSSAILYLAFAGSASTSAYTVQIPAQSFFEMPPVPVYTGAIFGIWASATGAVRITEMS